MLDRIRTQLAPPIFEGDEESPFMLLAKHVRPAWKERIPAVVHVDGTARVQTVRERQNPRLYRLLREFEAITGVRAAMASSTGRPKPSWRDG